MRPCSPTPRAPASGPLPSRLRTASSGPSSPPPPQRTVMFSETLPGAAPADPQPFPPQRLLRAPRAARPEHSLRSGAGAERLSLRTLIHAGPGNAACVTLKSQRLHHHIRAPFGTRLLISPADLPPHSPRPPTGKPVCKHPEDGAPGVWGEPGNNKPPLLRDLKTKGSSCSGSEAVE